jgi:uncharacterized repeat protein (TIGR03806 family)
MIPHRTKLASFLIGLFCVLPFFANADEKPYGLDKRTPLTTSTVKGTPEPPSPFVAKRIFPNLKFDQPLHVVKEPTSQRLFVVQRAGKIRVITHDQALKESPVLLDLKRDTYSLCFHPDYAKNGYIYIFSNGSFSFEASVEKPKDADLTKPAKQNRIARYTVDPKSPNTIDPKTETVILQYPSAGHNGHYVQFGPDGLMWISAGDGTVGMDPALDGQDVSNLRATMMRIDVDHPDKDRNYSVPKDNPFIGRNNTRPEIWAFGFRNPYRFTFEPGNGQLWVADIGQDAWEMIYRVKKGGNYGWSIMEGPGSLNSTREKGPGPIIPPTVSHPHSEMRSITGGFFYRGQKFPELRGAYLYGDYDSRRVFAIRYDNRQNKVTFQQEIATTKFRVISIDEDKDREIIIASYTGELLTLERRPAGEISNHDFPKKLSDTGLFTSTSKHKLVPAVIPYSVNSPLWADGAVKDRFIAVPGVETVGFTENRAWKFPHESVIGKTFTIETEPGNPKSKRRIETRLLLLGSNDEWTGYCYRWNKEQTDAFLVEKAGADETLTIRDPKSKTGFRKQTWHYPSRAECMVCHTREARYLLGLTTLQMNKAHNYGGVVDHQLRTLSHIGLFTKAPSKKTAEYKSLPDPHDQTQPLEARVRSYLHSNCAHCHVSNGGGNAEMLLEYTTDLAKAKIFDVKPRHITFNIKNARLIAPGSPERSLLLHRIARRGKHQMPPIASSLVDERAVKLLTDWIREVEGKTVEKK